MISIDFSGIQLKLKQDDEQTSVFDPVRKRWVLLTPEEHVRQYFLQYLIKGIQYPSSLIAVEKQVLIGRVSRRFDVAVYDRDHQPWMLIECKEPAVIINEDTLFQLLSYHHTIPCKYWVLTNGHQTYCANATKVSEIRWMEELPVYGC